AGRDQRAGRAHGPVGRLVVAAVHRRIPAPHTAVAHPRTRRRRDGRRRPGDRRTRRTGVRRGGRPMSEFAHTLARRMRTPLTMRDVLIRIWVIAWLTFVWVLLWGEFTPANVLGGLGVSLAILILMPLPQLPVEGRLHPLSAIRLVLCVAFDLFVSSVEVAWLSVRPGHPPMTAILRAHVAIKSDLVLGLLVDAINVVPGTIVLEVD